MIVKDYTQVLMSTNTLQTDPDVCRELKDLKDRINGSHLEMLRKKVLKFAFPMRYKNEHEIKPKVCERSSTLRC